MRKPSLAFVSRRRLHCADPLNGGACRRQTAEEQTDGKNNKRRRRKNCDERADNKQLAVCRLIDRAIRGAKLKVETQSGRFAHSYLAA